jgi:hypothetical protein
MDRVRCPEDITIITKNGDEWVIARSGGVSCYDISPTGLKGPEWRLPEDAEYPDSLYLRPPDPTDPNHWTWEPNEDMTLARFKDLLLTVGQKFECP